jgi:hypothetical protein
MSSLLPLSESLLNLPSVFTDNQLLKVELLADLTSIELILPSKEVAGSLSIDHSADDVSSSRCDLLIHPVLTEVQVFSSSFDLKLVFFEGPYHHEVFLSFFVLSDGIKALLESSHSVLTEESTSS